MPLNIWHAKIWLISVQILHRFCTEAHDFQRFALNHVNLTFFSFSKTYFRTNLLLFALWYMFFLSLCGFFCNAFWDHNKTTAFGTSPVHPLYIPCTSPVHPLHKPCARLVQAPCISLVCKIQGTELQTPKILLNFCFHNFKVSWQAHARSLAPPEQIIPFLKLSGLSLGQPGLNLGLPRGWEHPF